MSDNRLPARSSSVMPTSQELPASLDSAEQLNLPVLSRHPHHHPRRAPMALLTLLVAVSTVFGGVVQAGEECKIALLPSSKGDVIRLQEGATAERRFGWLKRVYESLNGRPYVDPKASDDIAKMMVSREFHSFLAFRDRMEENLRTLSPEVMGLVKPIQSPQEALLAKLMVIRQAKYTIDTSYYIFRADASGYVMLNEVKEALRRGVSVRLMVDSQGSLHPFHGELKALIEFANRNAGFMINPATGERTSHRAQVEVVVFNSISSTVVKTIGDLGRMALNMYYKALGIPELDMGGQPLLGADGKAITKSVPVGRLQINRRSHDKIVLADAAFPELAVAIFEGRNVADHYYGVPQVDEHTFRDLSVIVRNAPGVSLGPVDARDVGSEANRYFDMIYFHLGNKELLRGVLGLTFGYGKHIKRMESHAEEVNGVTKEMQAALGEDMSSPDFGKRYLSEGFMDAGIQMAHTVHNVVNSFVAANIEKNERHLDMPNPNGVETLLKKAMAMETEEIAIVSPYVWLKAEQVLLLKAWLLQDPNRRLIIISNSYLTSDNLLAQSMTEHVIVRDLVNDQGVFDKNGKQVRRSIANQFRFYQYGRLDAATFGGSVPYGKLHAKAVYLKASKKAYVGTYNGDVRSQRLNSEGGVLIVSEGYAEQGQRDLAELIGGSYLWGTPEQQAVRNHKALPGWKKAFLKYQEQIHGMLYKLHLWWMI